MAQTFQSVPDMGGSVFPVFSYRRHPAGLVVGSRVFPINRQPSTPNCAGLLAALVFHPDHADIGSVPLRVGLSRVCFFKEPVPWTEMQTSSPFLGQKRRRGFLFFDLPVVFILYDFKQNLSQNPCARPMRTSDLQQTFDHFIIVGRTSLSGGGFGIGSSPSCGGFSYAG